MNINNLNSANGSDQNVRYRKYSAHKTNESGESANSQEAQRSEGPTSVNLPEIRESVIESAIAKLKSGTFETQEAALNTAKSILGS